MKFMKASEIKKTNPMRLIYSQPGVGKTSTIKYIPGKKFVLDCDGSSEVLKGTKDIELLPKDKWQEIMQSPMKEIPKFLKLFKDENLKDFDVFVLDNLTELERRALNELAKVSNNNGVPTMMDYQKVQFWERDLVLYLQSFNISIVITAWEATDKFENGEQTINRAMPMLRTNNIAEIMGLCLQVGRLVINSETKKRGFILTPSNSIFAKNQIDNRTFALQEELFKDGDVKDETV